MNFTRTIYIFLLVLILPFKGFCQTKQETTYPQNYFRSPMDIPLKLAGNFGELRNNHFHNGLDIRTGGQEGLPVYAVADGYVSRIKIAPAAYGNCLYITHPNGYVSVYAHLKTMADTIGRYLKKAQYLNEKFEIELFPDPKLLKVKKGQLIAYSGNTGSSGGPHLHFEIREEKSEVTVNPMLFGFDVPDNVPPIIKSMYVFPVDEFAEINNINITKKIGITGANGTYQMAVGNSINVTGKIGFGIESIDHHSNSTNPEGIYSVELFVKDKLIFKSELDKVPFDENRYINSYCDYEIRKRNNLWIQKCFIDPGNKLSIYKVNVNNGVIENLATGEYDATIIVKDVNGNASTLKFKFTYTDKPLTSSTLSPTATKYFKCNQVNTFKDDEVAIELPANVLYKDLKFEYFRDTLNKTQPIYFIQNANTPAHTYYNISLSTKYVAPEKLDKALVVCLDYNGYAKSEGGTLSNGMLVAKSRSFGRFTVKTDVTSPTIKPVNILNGKNLAMAKAIYFKIHDNLAGLKSYRCEVDGKWILMEYDAKSSNLFHTFDNETIQKGRHHLKLVVTDYVGNSAEYEADFLR